MLLVVCGVFLGGGPRRAAAHSDADDRIHQISHEIERKPSAELYLKRALLYLEESAHQKARRDVQRAQQYKNAPTTSVLWIRARIELSDGRARQCLGVLDQLAKVSKPHAAHATLKARALMALAKPNEAATQLTQAIKLSPRPSANLVLEYASALEKANRHPEALNALQAGVRAQPRSTALRTRLIEGLARNARHREVEGHIEQLPTSLQQSPKYRLMLADALYAGQKKGKACQQYQAALQAILDLPAKRQNAPAFAELKTRATERARLCNSTP